MDELEDDKLVSKEVDPDTDKMTVGLTTEGKKVLKAAKANPKGGISRDETVLIELPDGYIFATKTGDVKYRTDLQHAEILQGNAFVEPPPRPQAKNAF